MSNNLNQIDLCDFFIALQDSIYCIIKKDDHFPDYYIGSDIDIFCYDISSISKVILNVGDKYLNQGCEIIIQETSLYKVQIDFYNKQHKKINFRFDLYQDFPSYKNINIRPGFFDCILENRKKEVVYSSNKKQKFNIFIPDLIDELIIRYLEYQEYYSLRPDKIKHINFILDQTKTEEKRKLFFTKLHHYSALPNIPEGKKNKLSSSSWVKWKLSNIIRNTLTSLKLLGLAKIVCHKIKKKRISPTK
jgi:hypothetical protein